MTLLTALLTTTAAADEQRWPFLFDVSLAADPTATGNQITQGAQSLPPLPVDEMTTIQTDQGTMTFWFWPENAALLTAIGSAGPDLMTWPTAVTLCAKHAAFAIPTLLSGTPSPTCTDADAAIRAQLAPENLAGCLLVEQPELYVYGYRPEDARSSTGTLEDLIGLAGEALTHAGPPLSGIVPADWVPTMRAILDQIRHDPLVQLLLQSKAAYEQATALVNSNASCFDPAATATLLAALGDLTNEGNAAYAHLEQLRTSGEAASAHENLCLAARSRVRNPLAFPSLTEAERKFIAFWLGGLYWRMRGGGLIPLGATQDARWYFLYQAYSRIGEVIGGPDAVDVAWQFWIEVMVDGWSDWQDMGQGGGGGDKYADLVGMTQRGQRQAQVGIDVIGPRGYDTVDLMAGGLQMGPGYYYAYWPLGAYRWAADLTSPYSGFIDWPTGIGEFNVGASLSLGLAKVLLAGKPTGLPPTVDLCSGRACGDDGCGGSCGTCGAGFRCDTAGQCVPEVTTPDAGAGDAGPVGAPDAGRPDPATADSGAADTGASGGADAPPTDEAPGGASGGCGCRTAASRAPAPGALALLLLGAARRLRRGRGAHGRGRCD